MQTKTSIRYFNHTPVRARWDNIEKNGGIQSRM